MVLLTASVCSKNGKAIISRQFVEMTKSRIEGLLAAFPKLMSGSVKQHTFVETDSVRYVYQPLEKLYMLLITTKTSNILEDLETLRLFSKVIPDYCRLMDESDIFENSFNLIFAFDEIASLGYRESVNLSQIRTFVEMDSHEEKVYQAVRQTQEREAKQLMREKAKDLQRQRLEAQKKGRSSGNNYGISTGVGFGSSSSSMRTTNENLSVPAEPPKPTYNTTQSVRKPFSSKAMKLGAGKSKDVDSFVDQLKSEGHDVPVSSTQLSAVDDSRAHCVQSSFGQPAINVESIHAKVEEKLTFIGRRDGGLENMEISGTLTLCITDNDLGRISLAIQSPRDKSILMQTHPNIDKELLKSKSVVALKNSDKAFPIHTDVSVVKWRFQTQDENLIPLTINCWPSDNGKGGCDVNIEFELENESLELNDVCITLPLPHGANPVVSECDGIYAIGRGNLAWSHAIVDASNRSGTLEFTSNGSPNDFFPVRISFYSNKTYSGIKVLDCFEIGTTERLKYSTQSILIAEKYEIV